MKTKCIAFFLMLGTGIITAQTANKPATVRIKKTEIINGVEKTTDTTFTTNDPSSLKMDDGTIDIREEKDAKTGKMIKTVSINGADAAIRPDGDMVLFTNDSTIRLDKGTTYTIDKSIHPDGKPLVIKKANCSTTPEELAALKDGIQVYVIKKVNVVEASDDELKLVGRQSGKTDGKLSVEKMDFYPNPTNGHFTLSFTLPDKGDTEVNVMNVNGESVFTEKLLAFTGNYNKQIDISGNAKGVYFVRVEQGKHALVKKIVVD